MSALTSFVGRDTEVAEVAALLDEYRLVTVTGPGGIGKTRLAAEVAKTVEARFADGVQMVELAAVREPGQVAAVVAAESGVPAAPGVPVIDALAAALGRQQVLLVLDNCEHLISAVAELCRAVLPHADDVRVLATSREPIGLAGETRFRLQPLPVSVPDDPPDQAVPAAVWLFADRARQADPRFALDGESGPLAARLVERLDGMPLAIELAAARVEAFGLAQLLDQLETGLQLLISTDRSAPERHQSLAGTVEWSYRLLSDGEQQVFRRLAIFPGPFTLEAAVVAAGADTEPVVAHLVDCSLLAPPRPGPDGRTRYLMLETIRAFGSSRLDSSNERPEAAAALTAHALAVAEQAAAGMRTGNELSAVRWFEAEDASIQQAAAWALEHDPEVALRLAVAVAGWWLMRGTGDAAREVLLAAAGQAAHGCEQWCLAQFWLGDIGPPAASLVHETAALEVLAAQRPTPLLAEVLAGRSRTLMFFGRIPEAVSDARQALDVARQIGYPAGEVLALATLSRAARYRGDTAAALDWARQARHLLTPGELGWTTRFTGPSAFFEVLAESGDFTAARRGVTDILAWARETGNLVTQAVTLRLMADVELRAGDFPGSGRYLREAIEITARVNPNRLIFCLDLSAHLCAARGQWAEAVTIWTAFQAGLEAEGSADLPLNAGRRQDLLHRAARVLGPGHTRDARERGAAMSMQAATEFALLLADPSRDSQPAQPATGLTQLSTRERELVSLVAKGRTDAQIADQLYISISTVRSHLDRIRDKTGSRRRADLTRLALQAGLI